MMRTIIKIELQYYKFIILMYSLYKKHVYHAVSG